MKKNYKIISFILIIAMLVPFMSSVDAIVASGAASYEVTQIDTTKFQMTFAEKTDITSAEIGVIVEINDFEATLPIKKLTVTDNIAIVELFTPFLDGFTYKVTYGKETQEFIGSIGAIDTVSFHYWTEEDGDNIAYVNTEIEPSVTKLAYELYDANGVNVTAAYEEEELTIEYSLLDDNENCELYYNELICNKPGAVALEISVAWMTDDGDMVEKTGNGLVAVKRRPALSFIMIKAGFINVEAYEAGALESFVGDENSPFWTNNMYLDSWVLGDSGNLQFAAVAKDNRGNTVTTGINEYGNNYMEDEDGNRVYPYGYFRFMSSNEEVVTIDDEGRLYPESAGTATIIIFFVDTTGKKERDVFAGIANITVSPERYVAAYSLASTSATIASATANASNEESFILTAYDQYGSPIALANGAEDIKVEATSSAKNIPVREVIAEESTEGGIHYHIDFDGDDFKDYLGTQKMKTVQYTVSVDNESNDKLTTNAATKIKLTIKNTSDYVKKLEDGTAGKYYYSIAANKESQDLAVTYIKNYSRTGAEETVKNAEITLNYLSATNGLPVQAVPADNIIKKVKKQTTGEAGKLYYEISAPQSAANWNYNVSDGKIQLTWNTANGKNTLKYATVGNYKVTIYGVKNTSSSNKLSELGTYTFAVTNSQAEPKLSLYDSTLDNRTSIPITSGNALAIVKENLKFTYDGEIIDWNTGGFTIKLKDITVTDSKLRVNKVEITVPVDDGNAATSYTYTKTLTVNKTIYYQEEE